MTTIADLISLLAPVAVHGAVETAEPIRAIRGDSRIVGPGDAFVAVSGASSDGHAYLMDAAARGASVLVGSRAFDPQTMPDDVPYVQVEDGRDALARASALLNGFPSRSLAVVGVTGTDGKTTTASLVESILVAGTRSDQFPDGRVGVVTTVGARIQGQASDTGLHVTTPDAPEVQRFLAEMRDAHCTYAVVESTSHGLHQKRVAAVDYDVAAVTNITHEHLDYHGTREAYVAAKALLFRALYHSPPKPGIQRAAILNCDDDGSIEALRAVIADEAATRDVPVRVLGYGLGRSGKRPDLLASSIRYRPDGTTFNLEWWGGSFPVESRLIGEFNVSNVLAACAVALALGFAPDVVQEGAAAFPGVVGRMERLDRGQTFTAIVDFAHSPASLERALLTLRPLVGEDESGAPGRLIAVFGSAGLRDKAKRRWMGQISGRLADYTVITAEDPRTEDVNDICREIESGVREFVGSDRYAVVADRSEAIRFAVNVARTGDIVAAFGKGHERSMCYGTTEYPWSDQEAMARALEQRMRGAPLVGLTGDGV